MAITICQGVSGSVLHDIAAGYFLHPPRCGKLTRQYVSVIIPPLRDLALGGWLDAAARGLIRLFTSRPMGLNAKKAFVTVAATCFALLAATLFLAGVFLLFGQGLDAAWRFFVGAILSAFSVAWFDHLWWQYEIERLARKGIIDPANFSRWGPRGM